MIYLAIAFYWIVCGLAIMRHDSVEDLALPWYLDAMFSLAFGGLIVPARLIQRAMK
jgi:hypothetical protein